MIRWPTVSPSSRAMVAGRISSRLPSTISSCCPFDISTTCPSSISTTEPLGISTTRPLGLESLKSLPSGSSTTSPLPSVDPGDPNPAAASAPLFAAAPLRGVLSLLLLALVSSSRCASAHSIAWGTPARLVARHARRACAGLNPTSARACVRKSKLFSLPAVLFMMPPPLSPPAGSFLAIHATACSTPALWVASTAFLESWASKPRLTNSRTSLRDASPVSILMHNQLRRFHHRAVEPSRSNPGVRTRAVLPLPDLILTAEQNVLKKTRSRGRAGRRLRGSWGG
mmetsp:Transcript_51882/g.105628  ORF Transcript_51882/g.105628 Transcript_51882/m.105628 type:complete len:284 (-) Transcript_51882:18-869(-)